MNGFVGGAELNKVGIKIANTNRNQFWLTGFFGSLHPSWPSEPLLTQLREAAIRQSRQVVLLSVGRLGPGDILWDRLAQQYSPHVHFCKLGEQPAKKVSQYLNSLDFGIATSPYSLVGKSGSVAAMIDHGLPVIINRDDEHFPGEAQGVSDMNSLLYKPTDDIVNELPQKLFRQPSQPRLPMVTQQLLRDLANLS